MRGDLCRRVARDGGKSPGTMTARKRPLPCMRWKGPLSPTSPTRRSLGPRIRGTRHHRSAEPRRTPVDTVPCLPERRLPEAARPVRQTLLRTPVPIARSRKLPALVLAGPEDVLRAGSPSLVACEISTAATRAAQGASQRDFRFLCSSTGVARLPPRQGMLSTGCPPVHPHARLPRTAQ